MVYGACLRRKPLTADSMSPRYENHYNINGRFNSIEAEENKVKMYNTVLHRILYCSYSLRPPVS